MHASFESLLPGAEHARVERVLAVPPEKVWEVLADGWLYPVFVVGASRMREVDDTWPAPGASLHHSVGSWPALIDDTTSVLEADPPRTLLLVARAWPGGEAHVRFTLEPHPDGCTVVLEEDAVKGPGTLMPSFLRRPMLTWRNVETLRRLAMIAERR